MASRQSEEEAGEELKTDFTLPGAGRAVTDGAPDQVTSQAGSSQDRDAPAGGAASSRSERMLFDNGIFSIARRSHPVELVLAGEIDFPSLPHLTAALFDAAGGSGALHVDLAGVYFCDLAALRTIVSFGQPGEDQQPGRQARPVVLHHVPDHIGRIMRIVGWDTIPGLAIDTGR